MSDEIAFHIEQQTENYIQGGMTPEAARSAALRRFGGRDQMKEAARDEIRAAWLEDFVRDIRYAARMLRRAPGFALVCILTLGAGIAAATTVFTVVEGVLLSPLPYPDPDRIVRVFQIDANGRRGNVSEPNYEDWRSGTSAFDAMAEMAFNAAALVSTGSDPAMTPGTTVSKEFFTVMGVSPIVGRGFTDDDRHIGAAPVALVSYAFWKTRLGGRSLDDARLHIDDRVYQVVGVMPETFDYPITSQYWLPRELNRPQTSRTAHNFNVAARLKASIDPAAANRQVSELSRRLKTQYGDGTWMSDATIVPLRDQLTSTARPVLLTLFVAAVFLLVIACLNASSLQLARASTRQREFALRLAIGSGRGRLLRQMLAEALLLTFISTALATLLSYWGITALVAAKPGNLPRIDAVRIDTSVLAFAAGTALLTAIALGCATAMRASKMPLRESLAEGARTMSGGRGRQVARQVLVVSQVALTVVLLAGAALLTRSFVAVMAIDTGYRMANAVVLDIAQPAPSGAAAVARLASIQQTMIDKLSALPGVETAALVSDFPLGGGWYANGQFFEMTRADEFTSYQDLVKLGEQAKARAGLAGYRVASDQYFRAMGIRLLKGRLFDERDGADAPHVAVISQSLADTKWQGQDPLGRFLQWGNMDGDTRGIRVVGVVSDVRELSPEAVPGPLIYLSSRQRPRSQASIVLVTSQESSVAQAAQAVARQADPEAGIRVRMIEEASDRAIAGRRFSLLLITVFGGVALVLATLGVYGLISYLVTERTREIGIRLALGAASNDVLMMVIGKGMVLAIAGLVVGLIAAFGLTTFVRGMLFGVSAWDWLSYVATGGITLLSVLAASYLPARRAMGVQPVDALRS